MKLPSEQEIEDWGAEELVGWRKAINKITRVPSSLSRVACYSFSLNLNDLYLMSSSFSGQAAIFNKLSQAVVGHIFLFRKLLNMGIGFSQVKPNTIIHLLDNK